MSNKEASSETSPVSLPELFKNRTFKRFFSNLTIKPLTLKRKTSRKSSRK